MSIRAPHCGGLRSTDEVAAYPEATVIRLVLDNLNTHKLGSLYEAFEPSEARRIAKGLEFHYTPIHGSWLNMAEIELSVFSRACLNRRRIGNSETGTSGKRTQRRRCYRLEVGRPQ